MLQSIVSAAEGWSVEAMLLRLLLAMIIGTVIGIDRGLKRRGAGVKTHALVCMGSALVMMTAQYMYVHFDPSKLDLSRMGAQVVSGVGFLGVGTIIVTGKNQIRGLTTAAGLWACACLGLAAGIGFVEGAFIALVLVEITLKILTKLDIWLLAYARVLDIYIEFPTNKCVTVFMDTMRSQGIKINSLQLGKSHIKGEGPNAILSIEVPDRQKRTTMVENIRGMECVRFVEEL